MVTNTKKQAEQDPLITLLMTAFGGGVEAQEAAGQQELVDSELLPIRGIDQYREGGPYASLGILIGEPASADPDELFVKATLPKGWSKQATSHSMWSKIVDDKGRERISVFYKAAYYDRNAHISSPIRRYVMTTGPNDDCFGRGKFAEKVILDNAVGAYWDDSGKFIEKEGSFIFRVTSKVEGDNSLQVDADLTKKCQDFMAKNFPKWEDPLAYWD